MLIDAHCVPSITASYLADFLTYPAQPSDVIDILITQFYRGYNSAIDKLMLCMLILNLFKVN